MSSEFHSAGFLVSLVESTLHLGISTICSHIFPSRRDVYLTFSPCASVNYILLWYCGAIMRMWLGVTTAYSATVMLLLEESNASVAEASHRALAYVCLRASRSPRTRVRIARSIPQMYAIEYTRVIWHERETPKLFFYVYASTSFTRKVVSIHFSLSAKRFRRRTEKTNESIFGNS